MQTKPERDNKKDINLHRNHRKRVRDKFLRFGLEPFCDHEVLELLLFYVLPQVDTNEIAHQLINKAGSFSQVFELPVDEMKQIKGLKEEGATFLKLIPAIARYYTTESAKEATSPRMTYEEIAEYVVKAFIGMKNETVIAFYFDSNMHRIKDSVIKEGGSSSVETGMRKIIDEAMTSNASSVVIAHNHPEFTLIPSYDDIESTKRLKKLLSQLDINLLEHFIVSADKYTGILKFYEDATSNYER